MSIIMFHSGLVLPVFLECNFKQMRLFNPDMDVFFITDDGLRGDPVFHKYKIVSLDKDRFYSDKIHQFGSLYNNNPNDFWTIAATRLIYIENFLKEFKLTDVYHFENDVLLYYDLKEHHGKFQDLYKNMAITTGGPDKSMTGFMFIKNSDSLSMMTRFFIDILQVYGIKGTLEKYGMDMVNEMTLMRVYGKEHPSQLQDLPILPYGEFSKNFLIFNSIFDPASWGQFIGGTMDGIPGAKPQDHYIGRMLKEHPDYTVIFSIDNEGRKIPYFKYSNNEIKINNLHIHSKNLNKYMSK